MTEALPGSGPGWAPAQGQDFPASVSAEGRALIKEFEGLRLAAYRCPAGVWTIGYGATRGGDGGPVPEGLTITHQQAATWLTRDLKEFAADVRRLVTVPLTQGQFDALVDFAFNLGADALAGSTLLRKLNAGDYDGAALELPKWRKARVDGKLVPLPGLIRRRAAFLELFTREMAPEPVETAAPPHEGYAPAPEVEEHERVSQSGSAKAAAGAVVVAAPAIGLGEIAEQAHTASVWLDVIQRAGPWVALAAIVGAAAYIFWRRRKQIAEVRA